MLSRKVARFITLETQNMDRLLGAPLRHLGHNNSSDIYVEAMDYLNSPISVLNLAQKDIGNGRKGFADASDCLETWDDSDNITAVNAQKYRRHATQMVALPLRSTISRFRDQ